MKKIGFLSFGHWTPSSESQTQSAADTLLQSIDLAGEAERLGMDGAYFRVHHFARQLASPFPLLAAVGAKTRKIEIGTAGVGGEYDAAIHSLRCDRSGHLSGRPVLPMDAVGRHPRRTLKAAQRRSAWVLSYLQSRRVPSVLAELIL